MICTTLLLLFLLVAQVRPLCNSTGPVDTSWLDGARARCAEIPQCDRVYGVTRGLTAASFAELVVQAGALNTSAGLDAYVCDRPDAQAALDMFVVFLALHPPLESCPPQQEYRPASRTCAYPLDHAPLGESARDVLDPLLLTLVFLALVANVVVRQLPRARRRDQ
jgi:hypothetical protein